MRCPRCQHENPDTVRFCGECGARLVSPEKYTPQHLVETILASKRALEGERKQVTVLFADLKGSMELLADRDPEQAGNLLDSVLERMMEAVHRYEGTVNQVMGDGIMAPFGVPLACEDHAVRACYAALRMQEMVKLYAEGVLHTEGVAVQIRVGLNSGEVVVRSIGNDLRTDYSAVGRNTHLAARLEQMARPGSILLSAETLALAEGYVDVRSLGPLPVKGIEAPLEVYELTRAATVRSRFQAAATRGLSRFVGRETELEHLRHALERARDGHGQVVAVVGEPGIGKSRLYWELIHSHRTHGWLLLESRSVSFDKATSYLPIIDLLRSYFAIEHAYDPVKIRDRVMGKVLSLDRQLEPSVPPILWLLDVPFEDETWERLDPPHRREHILDGVKRLLLREAEVPPLVVVFEDLHWIDAETQALLDGLVESLPAARLLLLVNYRPEYGHDWGSKTYYRQLQIDPLPSDSAEGLLDVLLGNDPALTPLKRLVIDRTEGNPFFMEECVRSLVETGVLVGERGAYRVFRSVQGLQIPATVQAMLAARIDRLASENKRLLQAAAVIGADVPYELLRAVADEPDERVRQGLASLQATEFLYETRLFPDLEYTFRHALTREVAYASLLTERRRALHARIVEAIESLYPERLTEQVERLAHHALRGENWDKALPYLRQAGTKAAARSAYRDAVSSLEEALQALLHLPETRKHLEQAVDVRLDLRNALLPLGEHRRILTLLTEARPFAHALDDRHRLGWVYAYLTPHSCFVGEYDRAVEAGQRAVEIAEALEERALQVMTNFFLSLVYFILGRHREAVQGFRRSVAILQGPLVHERFAEPGLPAVFSRCFLAWSLAELGEFAEGIATAEEAIRIADGLDEPFTLMHAYLGLGMARLRRGDVDEAASILDRTLETCRRGDIPFWVPEITSGLGLAHALAGRVADGLPFLERAAAYEATWQVARGLIAAQLAEGYLLAGRLSDAGNVARNALDLSREYKARGSEAYALQLLGAAIARQDTSNVKDPQERCRKALALADELSMRPLAAHCHLGLGRLYSRARDGASAKEHLTTAAAMYDEMNMRLWSAQAETELRRSA